MAWPAQRWRRWGRWQRVVTAALAVVVLVVAVDVGLLIGRLRHVEVAMPAGGTGTTWVIAGSDSRSAPPPGTAQSTFGSTADVPGARSDVVLVVHVVGGHVHAISVPRDLLVSPAPGTFERLTLTYLRGPQALVDGLCDSLGIAATHLVVVDFATFASVIDDLGGVDVVVPAPVRDAFSDLSIAHAGRTHLDGATALALVRSRMPEYLVDGRWQPVSEADGAAQRTAWSGRLLRLVAARARSDLGDPFALQRVAWDATGGLVTDTGTGLLALAGLARTHVAPVDLPARPLPDSIAVTADAATHQGLVDAGYGGRCRATR